MCSSDAKKKKTKKKKETDLARRRCAIFFDLADTNVAAERRTWEKKKTKKICIKKQCIRI